MYKDHYFFPYCLVFLKISVLFYFCALLKEKKACVECCEEGLRGRFFIWKAMWNAVKHGLEDHVSFFFFFFPSAQKHKAVWDAEKQVFEATVTLPLAVPE